MKFDKYLASIEDTPEIITYIAAAPVTIVLFFAVTNIKDGICLKKDFNTKNTQKVLMTPEIIEKHSDVDKTRLSKFRNALVYSIFIEKLNKMFSRSNLKNFYNNINSLKIGTNPIGHIDGIEAYYKPENNTIYFCRNGYNIEIVFHELLHMASTICKNGMVYCGFSQKKKYSRKVIGAGLTEGYTQLLTRRMYKDTYEYRYYTEVEIAKIIETIIGKEKMENLYFNANLKWLVEELSKYSDEQETLKFIKRLDFITKYETNKENNTRREEILLVEAYKDVYTFLLKTYVEQQKELYRKNEIDKEEFINRIANYIYDIKLDSYRGDYNLLNKKNKDEIIKSILIDSEYNTKVQEKLYTVHMKNSN